MGLESRDKFVNLEVEKAFYLDILLMIFLILDVFLLCYSNIFLNLVNTIFYIEIIIE